MAAIAVSRPVVATRLALDVEALLRRIVALEARVAALEPPADAQFLATIAASVKGHVFSSAELRKHARVDATLQRVLRGLTNRELGNRLRTLADRHIDGYVLTRVGRDQAGCIWALLHEDGSVGAAAGT
jgi:hypothetical protein